MSFHFLTGSAPRRRARFYGLALLALTAASACHAEQQASKDRSRRVLLGQKSEARSVTWSPDSRRLATIDAPGQILRLWNPATGRQVQGVTLPQVRDVTLPEVGNWIQWTKQGLLAVLAGKNESFVW